MTDRRHRLARRAASPLALLAVTLGLLVIALIAGFASLSPQRPGREAPLGELLASVDSREVAAATFAAEDQVLRWTDRTATPRWTSLRGNDATTSRLIADLSAARAPVAIDAQEAKATRRTVLTTIVPLVLLANLFALIVTGGRQRSGGLGDVIDFGRLRRGRAVPGSGGVTGFADVAGVDEAVTELAEIVDHLRAPARFVAMGARPPKGIVLFGPPGCGKTLLAKSVAAEAGVPFFSVAAAEFVEALVGVGAARVRDLFARARAAAPAIIFIDELDAAGRARTGSGSEERDQTLNQLLVEMDGFDPSAGVVVIAATNRPDVLDPALLRPGRFDRHVTIDLPDAARRAAILTLHATRVPTAPDADLDRIAQRTTGFSGAELAAVINESALVALRHGSPLVDDEALDQGVERVRFGPQRTRGALDTPDRTRLAAHALGPVLHDHLCGQPPETAISILGSHNPATPFARPASSAPLDDAAALRRRICRALAGRATEELVSGSASTAGEQGLAEATALATDLVARYGLSSAGTRRYAAVQASAHLGERPPLELLGPSAADRIDAAIDDTLTTALREVVSQLRLHGPAVRDLVHALAAAERLTLVQLTALLPGPASDPPPATNGRSGRPRDAARRSRPLDNGRSIK